MEKEQKMYYRNAEIGVSICPSGNMKEDFLEEAAWILELGLQWAGFKHEEMGRKRQSKQNHVVLEKENCRALPKARE